MRKTQDTTLKASGVDQQTALASPLRLEILGLFTTREPLAIADMARQMGRSAGSLYHHVGILVKAGILEKTGTRPKGKRYEALYRPVAARIEMDPASTGEEGTRLAVKAMSAAFRMAERDLEAALSSGNCNVEGPGRELFATRLHMRASPKFLAKLNKHLQAIEDLLTSEAACDPKPTPEDKHLSFTLALLPLKGRGTPETE